MNLNYIELPILISYSIAKWCNLDFGQNISYKISAAAKGDGSSQNIDTFYDKDLDLGLIAGLRVPLPSKFTLIGRYYLGLSSISELNFTDVNGETTSVKEYNRTGQFGISYRFN
ncbi:MAG TPA: outer membrane beta-barrel protein [Ohtaekwangia sp.]|nr:outer membrane beta-barrel protein [Ohtaekwangia sp.]